MNLTPVGLDHIRSHNLFRGPITAFHQMFRPYLLDQRQGRVVVEGCHQRYASKRGQYGEAVRERVNGTPRTLFQSAHGGVTVDADNQ